MEHDTTVSGREAAEMLGITRQAVHQLIHRGRLPARQVYGLWRIERADVEALRIRNAQRRESAS